jgi:hypothetical protein
VHLLNAVPLSCRGISDGRLNLSLWFFRRRAVSDKAFSGSFSIQLRQTDRDLEIEAAEAPQRAQTPDSAFGKPNNRRISIKKPDGITMGFYLYNDFILIPYRCD